MIRCPTHTNTGSAYSHLHCTKESCILSKPAFHHWMAKDTQSFSLASSAVLLTVTCFFFHGFIGVVYSRKLWRPYLCYQGYTPWMTWCLVLLSQFSWDFRELCSIQRDLHIQCMFNETCTFLGLYSYVWWGGITVAAWGESAFCPHCFKVQAGEKMLNAAAWIKFRGVGKQQVLKSQQSAAGWSDTATGATGGIVIYNLVLVDHQTDRGVLRGVKHKQIKQGMM